MLCFPSASELKCDATVMCSTVGAAQQGFDRSNRCAVDIFCNAVQTSSTKKHKPKSSTAQKQTNREDATDSTQQIQQPHASKCSTAVRLQWRRRLLASVAKDNLNQNVVVNNLGFKNVTQERKKWALVFVSHTTYKHGLCMFTRNHHKEQLAPAAMLLCFGNVTLLPRETQDLK